MLATVELHDAVADLLTYPGPDGGPKIRDTIAAASEVLPGAAEHLEALAALTRSEPPGALEETFCRTFDNNANRALEVGWQIWGENYDRGAFLVRMRQLMRDTGVSETTELPDHLSHVLRVTARLGAETSRDFVISTVLPAVRKIRDGFKDSEDSPYLGVVEVAHLVLEEHLKAPEAIHE